ncbi:DgyrCDS12569 [Dimorphilus gyrociliatus]|uniref:Serine/threonine-protein phosphatase 2A activator n=1 Tax=Dimorphilus gyrociliatus TaxID=2664684 RepID=A0A7I8W8L8_9ANNE|nr:DgyrCDS12569 [Dimorphilus gyrociliatus]
MQINLPQRRGPPTREESLPTAKLEPVDLQNHNFKKPTKQITSIDDIKHVWEKSVAYRDLLGFIRVINEAVKNKKMSEEYYKSENIEKLLTLLDTLSVWIDEVPPIEQPQRFGNKAFRIWFDRLKQQTESLLRERLDAKFEPAIEEISLYFIESFGNDIRIDYGTGHEMAFVTFLCCLFKIGLLNEKDYVACSFAVFEKYLELMRKLQQVYKMEPAGSHGVWSLDDYQFIPFIWGSAQFIDNHRLSPKSIADADIVNTFSKDYMFLRCIQYINSVKTGPFAEHSNQLWNISGVQLWSKVNNGLFKMYKAEVLAKFPVIQHYFFGSLMTTELAND